MRSDTLVGTAPEVISAIADLLWPVLVVAVVLFGYRHRKSVAPALRDIVRTREVSAELPGGFKLDVGGQPVTAQQVADDQREQTEELRRDLSALAARVEVLMAVQGEPTETPLAPPTDGWPPSLESTAGLTGRVLWVDDHPTNNAYEIAALKDRGVEVDVATSTSQALEMLANEPGYDSLVTDLRRTEEGADNPTAGLTLLRELRALRLDLPVVVYASVGGARRYGERAIELGAVGATANPTELLELLAVNYGPHFARRFTRQVRLVIERSPWELVEQGSPTRVDFLTRRDSRLLGIEAKAWVGDFPPQLLQKELDALADDDLAFPTWIVTPASVALPSGTALPVGIEVLPLADLGARLATA